MKFFWIALLLSFYFQAHAATDEPAGCLLKKSFPCALRSDSAEWIETSNYKLRTDRGTTVILKNAKTVEIAQGQVWIETKKATTFAQSVRSFQVTGEAWLQKQKGRIKILTFSGETQVQGLYAHEILPAGFQNWWEIDRQGMMLPFQTAKTLTDWNRWVAPEAKDALARIEAYKALWSQRAESSAQFYQDLTKRRLASISEAEDKKVQAAKAKQAEADRYRQMFRDRYYQKDDQRPAADSLNSDPN